VTTQNVEIVHEPGACIVTLTGDIEELTAPVVLAEALTALNDCPDGARQIVIDVSGVTFLDSTGLGMLVEVRNAAISRDAAVSLRGVTPRIAHLLRVTSLDGYFGV
jgi:anti-sigma B factor antagonist